MKKNMRLKIMAALIAMSLINIFALKISTIVLMLVAAAVGFTVYMIKARQRGGK